MTKKVLDFGCGTQKRSGAIGIDILNIDGVDVVHDLNVFPYPFESNSFDEIYADHVLEHIGDLIATMKELYRIGKPGAMIYVRVPHASSCGTAWADPTHRRFFVLRSFEHFDKRSDPYQFGIDLRIISRKLNYFLHEGVRNGVVLQRLPLWLHKTIGFFTNFSFTSQQIMERLFIYYVGGFEEVYFEIQVVKNELGNAFPR